MALQDVADAFVAVLTQSAEQNDGREYIITGPEAVTWSDAAESATRALGRPIAFDDMSRDDFRAMMISWGAFTDDFTTLTGRPGTTVDQWWQQNAEHFLTPLKEGERF